MVERALKAAVLGDGGWGTALAIVLAGNGHHVLQWGAFPDYIETLKRSRINSRYLPEVTIPPSVELTADLGEALWEAQTIVFAVPTQYLRSVAGKVAQSGFDRKAVVVGVSKGLEVGTLKRGSEILREILNGEIRLGGLFGPSHAEEVANRQPTSIVAASEDSTVAAFIQQAFNSPFFRVYTNRDLVGVEICGAVKNIIAIAAGLADGLGLGDNARAALITRGLAEMARLGKALGADPITFSGLAGVGDLICTCHSIHSRNRRVGIRIAQGETLAGITSSTSQVAEGVESSKSVLALARKLDVSMPIVEAVHAVLFKGKPLRQAAWELMTRDPKPELEEFRSGR